MIRTPKSLRCHIGLYGRRNVGKSSLLNAMTRQQVSIVSDTAGTTTDPVEKPMELLPLGPVLFIDTAGIDDTGELGLLRVQKTRQALDRTDIGVIVTLPGEWDEFEEQLLQEMRSREIPVIVVFNKTDLGDPDPQLLTRLEADTVRIVHTVAVDCRGITAFRDALLQAAPEDVINNPPLIDDLIDAGDLVVLVTPIDKEAPKGRLIMPQVRSIRNILDTDAVCMVTKERELRHALDRLTEPPRLVITDSQAFLKVAADTPPSVPMTSFSILFARYQGDLLEMVRGTMAIDRLKAGDKVLIAEACSHHPIAEDIGRVKIPRWLTRYVGGKLDVTVTQGRDFPDDLASYQLVIHCGACTFNRRAVLSRLLHCRQTGVSMTNYGLTIAWSLGIFERALEPFPSALALYHELRRKKCA